ncbi:MAG: 6-bladed beta-propeller, partial [Candidatus Aminicenantes bacterium]|nr:6-bladed beta-propeller [Candidatus Aminicenantes bacterium]
ITDPQPTHDESRAPLRKLVKVAEITSNLEDEFFLVRPWNVRADNQGNIYVFDLKVRKFFKYNENFKLVRVFGNTGQGPGEYAPGSSLLMFDIDEDGFLHVIDHMGRKYMKLDDKGNPIEEFRLQNHAVGPAHPVFDSMGNLFVYHPERNGISLMSREGKIHHTFLSLEDYALSLFRSIPPPMYSQWTSPEPFSTAIRPLPAGRAVVYLMATSTLYLLGDRRIEKQIRIWPREQMSHFRKSLSRDNPRMKNSVTFMFMGLFLDHDRVGRFYLQPPGYRPILKLDLDGRLIKRLQVPGKAVFHSKRNHLFFATWEDRVIVLKEGS